MFYGTGPGSHSQILDLAEKSCCLQNAQAYFALASLAKKKKFYNIVDRMEEIQKRLAGNFFIFIFFNVSTSFFDSINYHSYEVM